MEHKLKYASLAACLAACTRCMHARIDQPVMYCHSCLGLGRKSSQRRWGPLCRRMKPNGGEGGWSSCLPLLPVASLACLPLR